MPRKPLKYADIGSVSSGTMRPEDLIPEFAGTLEYLAKREPRLAPAGWRKLAREANKLGDYDSEDAGYILDELFTALEAFAPFYFYFGAHEGDGADYGYWLPMDFESDSFDGIKVNDTAEVPRDYRGEVLHVNDHGNCTLYVAAGRKGRAPALTEVWGIV